MIQLEDVSIQVGSFRLAHINMRVPAGNYAVLMGTTGLGKTTILEAIVGLRHVVSGRVLVDGRDVTAFKPAQRGIGYVPQDLALFPTMSVRQNLEFALRIRRASAAKLRQKVAELAAVLGIDHLLDRSVINLSGGEGQRVALGRALAFEPSVLLLDEPLAALDETTHGRLCDLLKTTQLLQHVTVIHVTHSRREARQLAKQLFVIEKGEVAERRLAELM